MIKKIQDEPVPAANDEQPVIESEELTVIMQQEISDEGVKETTIITHNVLKTRH